MNTLKPYIWVIEMKPRRGIVWKPTVGVGLSRKYAVKELCAWESDFPDDDFRITKYEATNRTAEELIK